MTLRFQIKQKSSLSVCLISSTSCLRELPSGYGTREKKDILSPSFCSHPLNMLKALAGICLLHLTTIFFLFWATIDDAWWFTDTLYTDLWGRWVMENNDNVWVHTDIPTSYRKDYLQAVQAFAVLSCMFAVFSLAVFIIQLFFLAKGKRFILSGVVQLISCFCIMVALSIYTDHFHQGEKDGWYGWSYIMAWFGWLLTLFTGIMYIILRKRVD